MSGRRARLGACWRLACAWARYAWWHVATGDGQRALWAFVRACVRAAKLLPTVRRALPWYVLPILALAAVVKCWPADFGADETLFALAGLLIARKRPGLLRALYREAQAGKPVRCQCERHRGER